MSRGWLNINNPISDISVSGIDSSYLLYIDIPSIGDNESGSIVCILHTKCLCPSLVYGHAASLKHAAAVILCSHCKTTHKLFSCSPFLAPAAQRSMVASTAAAVSNRSKPSLMHV